MALHSLYCADVPLRNCSLTHSASNFGPSSLKEYPQDRFLATPMPMYKMTVTYYA